MRSFLLLPLLPVFAVHLPLLAAAEEFTVLTYNVENLFDADGVAMFDEYAMTGGEHAYSPAKVLLKLQHVAGILKTFNRGKGPDIVAFNEFEMDFTPETGRTDYASVLEEYSGTSVERMLTKELDDAVRDLPAEALLLKKLEDQGMTGYQLAVGQDTPDIRALGTNDRRRDRRAHKNAVFSKFPIKDVRSHSTPDARDILEVTLDVHGHPLTVFVNHWKSRAGDQAAEQTRRLNARTLRERLSAIFAADPAADVIVTGDFNSHYNQSKVNPHLGKTAINDVLGSQGDEAATAASQGFSLYNLWHELPPAQRFSDHHNGEWGTLMQKMITPGLYDHRGVQYIDNSFEVVILEGINTVGPFNLPRRWTNAGRGYGWSDHFPIAARFRTVETGDATKRIRLVNPGKDDAPDKPMQIGMDEWHPAKAPAFNPEYVKNPAVHIGEIFRVRGQISSVRPVAVRVAGKEYLLHSHDEDLRRKMRSFPEGARVEFAGELTLHRGRLQFLVKEDDWVLRAPERKRDWNGRQGY